MKAEVFLPDDYRPAEDEPFMNDRQLEYFRRQASGLEAGASRPVRGNHRQPAGQRPQRPRHRRPRLGRDRPRAGTAAPATASASWWPRSTLRSAGSTMANSAIVKSRANRSVSSVLMRVPIATMTLEAQEKHERREKVHRDD